LKNRSMLQRSSGTSRIAGRPETRRSQ
jgi:hypothetical protein